MTYSFWNNSGTELNKIKFKKNENWSEIAKKTNNAKFNSLWTLVDNGDGIVQKDEIKMLNKLLKRAFNCLLDKCVCKLRRGLQISFYVK